MANDDENASRAATPAERAAVQAETVVGVSYGSSVGGTRGTPGIAPDSADPDAGTPGPPQADGPDSGGDDAGSDVVIGPSHAATDGGGEGEGAGGSH